MEWNQLHLRLVRQHLGGHPAARTEQSPAAEGGPTSLRGEPVSELERLSERSVFPLLWKSVDDAYRQATPNGATQI
jgi:tryptophan 2,3-dioxygenase